MANGKQTRKQKILEILAARRIRRQEELGAALDELGISVTQSTLSKDIKELGVVKVPEPDGGFRYQATAVGRASLRGESLLLRELQDFVVGVDASQNILVLKTVTGHAQGVCEAIDQTEWSDVVGTIAGENTIFLLCRTEKQREALRIRVSEMAGIP